jgi:hypothetical protein
MGMKKKLFQIFVLFLATVFFSAGITVIIPYSMDPDAYGFYDIWAGYLYLSVSVTLIGALLMIHFVKRLERRLL